MKKIIAFVFIFCVACAQRAFEKNDLLIPPVDMKVVD